MQHVSFYQSSRSRYNASTPAPLAGYCRLVPGILSVGNVLYLQPSEEDQYQSVTTREDTSGPELHA